MARRTFIGFTAVISVFQLSLGVALLICDLIRLTYSERHSYFIGACIAGVPMTLAGIVSFVIFRRANRLDINDRHDVKIFSCLIALEISLGIVSLIGCVVGCLFVVSLGLQHRCHSYMSENSCGDSTSQSQLNAVISIGLIIASSVVSFLVAICDCACKRYFGVYFCRPPRRSNFDHITIYQTTAVPPIAVDRSCPSNVLPQQVAHRPHRSRIQELEEENRLLQEQVRLQREQLELQQQLNEQGVQGSTVATPRYTPPPPSYDDCTSNESAIQLLEEHNKQLQRRCQEQQQDLQDYSLKQFPLEGHTVTPSAPPE